MSADEKAARRSEAARWVMVAAEDLRVARACLGISPPAIGVAAYHSQQAAEKLLKGLLIVAGAEFRLTHDLDRLASTALPHYPDLKENLEVLRPITAWGIAYRYPGPELEPEPLPEAGEIECVIELLAGLASRLRTLAAG